MTAALPVAPGTAEQLARVLRFRDFETLQPEELTAVARWIVGRVGDAEALLAELLPDCLALWHLVTDDWDDRDLDGLTEDEWDRLSFATREQEDLHRYGLTLARLVADIEGCIWRARLAAATPRAVSA